MTDVIYDSMMRVELIKHNISDVDVARAAWVSNYGSDAREKDPGRIEGLLKFLYRNEHMSPFEHGSATFYAEVPIFVAREWMRHRTQSYNEWSGRYSDMLPRFYMPWFTRPLVQSGKIGDYKFEPGTNEQLNLAHNAFEIACETCWEQYEKMKEAGIANEVARDVLPLATYTKFYATANLRNILNFIRLRTDPTALFEIREAAGIVEESIAQIAPLSYKAYKEIHK